MNLKFSMLNNLSKDLQKTDTWKNLGFTWPQLKKLFFLLLPYFGPQAPAKFSKYSKYLYFV